MVVEREFLFYSSYWMRSGTMSKIKSENSIMTSFFTPPVELLCFRRDRSTPRKLSLKISQPTRNSHTYQNILQGSCEDGWISDHNEDNIKKDKRMIEIFVSRGPPCRPALPAEGPVLYWERAHLCPTSASVLAIKRLRVGELPAPLSVGTEDYGFTSRGHARVTKE